MLLKMEGRWSYSLFAEAQRCYASAVAKTNSLKSADGRRVLTREHMVLKSAIDAYRRTGDYATLRSAIDECSRTVELWTSFH